MHGGGGAGFRESLAPRETRGGGGGSGAWEPPNPGSSASLKPESLCPSSRSPPLLDLREMLSSSLSPLGAPPPPLETETVSTSRYLGGKSGLSGGMRPPFPKDDGTVIDVDSSPYMESGRALPPTELT